MAYKQKLFENLEDICLFFKAQKLPKIKKKSISFQKSFIELST